MRVTVPSYAKINLDLRVLGKRPDGYHELRTIFQTISLKDDLVIEVKKQKQTQIELASSVEIPDNLVLRSARKVLEHLKTTSWVRFALKKRIPMGAGLGGGSSNAAAVLLALPALLGKSIPYPDLVRLAEELGSDVPFFLKGGTVLGLGRGTELYPLPDQPGRPVLVAASGTHVSTAEAYLGLNRGPLTDFDASPMLGEFQTVTFDLHRVDLGELPLKNDFEESVFRDHPELPKLVRKLRRVGARPALMTGSGSALFGLFPTLAAAKAAANEFPADMAFPVQFVTRQQYARVWARALGEVH